MVQSNAKEIQGASPVHWRAGDIEREPNDRSVHENTEVVAKISARHPEGPHAGENKNGANSEQHTANQRLVNRRIERLVSQSQLVDMVTENPEREDGESKEVATLVRASEDASQEVIVVLFSTVSQNQERDNPPWS